jgi:hypothetical protein
VRPQLKAKSRAKVGINCSSSASLTAPPTMPAAGAGKIFLNLHHFWHLPLSLICSLVNYFTWAKHSVIE